MVATFYLPISMLGAEAACLKRLKERVRKKTPPARSLASRHLAEKSLHWRLQPLPLLGACGAGAAPVREAKHDLLLQQHTLLYFV